jgi:hypothetical protein
MISNNIAAPRQRRIAGVSLATRSSQLPPIAGRRPRRRQQPTVSSTGTELTTAAQEAAQLPTLSQALRQCSLIQQLMTVPCNVRLTQQRYYALTATQRSTLSSSTGQTSTLVYSILNTAMNRIIYEISNACSGGAIEVLIFGNIRDTNTNRTGNSASPQRVIDAGSKFDLDAAQQCLQRVTGQKGNDQNGTNQNPNSSQVRWIYVPVGARWTIDPRVRSRAEAEGEEFVCGASECDTGHAMALLIDTQNKTVELFDPNGAKVPWYRPIADYIARQLDLHPEFQSYRLFDNSELPPYGVQAGSNLALCAYFSSLYVAIRLSCQEWNATRLNQELLKLNATDLRLLLQLWHCYLVQYTYTSGILDATERLSELHNAVFSQLINLPAQLQFYNRRPRQQSQNLTATQLEQLWSILTRITDNASEDTVRASAQMQRFHNRLSRLMQ